MTRSLARRAVLSAILAGGTGVGALSPVNGLVEGIAPVSGSAYRRPREAVPDDVENPHGSATVTYDDHHIPHVEADSEPTAYFAVGYVQAADRLFQMDLFRRRGDGRLAEVAGPGFVEADVFRAKMDFRGGAEASREAIAGSDTERMLSAYADGVNAYIERGPPGLGFELLDYDPDPWTVTDTLLIAMALNEQQTLGGFPALREAVKRRAFDEKTYRTLSPRHLDHGAPVVRDRPTDRTSRREPNTAPDPAPNVDPAFVDWLDQFGGPDLFGSNAWVVSGDYTDTGSPIVCNDPHLPLRAPPMFYQQHVTADGLNVGGVAFPGSPFVMAGENDHGAWGFTSAPVDLLDCYTYETDGSEYRYDGGWHEFETEVRTVPVRYGEDRQVTVKKTVHGPFIERNIEGETRHIGVAWLPLTGTRTLEALYGWNTADGMEAFREATRKFDTPPLHVHYADKSGNTLYQLAATVPIRRVGGEVVAGDRVFDGSAGDAEWAGYEPYGQSSFEGFVPFEEIPSAVNPDYAASANQRPADDPAYPLAREHTYGFRARRIYERLDRAAKQGVTMDRAFMQSVQLDTLDLRARELVPAILDARDGMSDRAAPWLDALADWDYRMDRDSKAALLFKHFLRYFEEETWRDVFEPRGLSETYWPPQWVLVTLPPDSEFFDGDRASVMATAVERAVDRIEDEGWTVYGDDNRPGIEHLLGSLVTGLNYPEIPIDGSATTVNAWYGFSGVAYRLIADLDGESVDILPGGNDGSAYSEHYHDQLGLWADGEYTSLGSTTTDSDIRFKKGDT